MAEKRRGLGRGISALIPTGPTGPSTTQAAEKRPTDVFFPESATVSEASGRAESSAAEKGAPTVEEKAGKAAPTKQRKAAASTTAASTDTPSRPAKGGKAKGRVSVPPVGAAARSAESPAPSTKATTPEQPAAKQPAADPPAPETAAPTQNAQTADASDEGLRPVPGASFAELAVTDITPNAKQPRQVFDEDDLEELTASIREVGLLQPIVVRPREAADVSAGEAPYELVMGERRWRATQRAGVDVIPAIVRTTTDDDLLRDALLENLHRAQLNPLEEASAYQQLLDDFACTHEELARRIARSRPQISNTLRLLKLPPLVQRRVASGVLSAGHARALLGLQDAAAMERLAQRIVAEGLSVRSTEEIVALGEEPAEPELRRRKRESVHSESLQRLSGRLADRFDTRVKVTMGARKGRIAIEFAGQEDLERILETLAPGDRGLAEEPLGAE